LLIWRKINSFMSDPNDIHDQEVRNIMLDLKRLSMQDTAQYYSGGEKGLTAVAASMREISPIFFRDMLDAMNKIQQTNPVKPGTWDSGRL
jgi:hypothetical protein